MLFGNFLALSLIRLFVVRGSHLGLGNPVYSSNALLRRWIVVMQNAFFPNVVRLGPSTPTAENIDINANILFGHVKLLFRSLDMKLKQAASRQFERQINGQNF